MVTFNVTEEHYNRKCYWNLKLLSFLPFFSTPVLLLATTYLFRFTCSFGGCVIKFCWMAHMLQLDTTSSYFFSLFYYNADIIRQEVEQPSWGHELWSHRGKNQMSGIKYKDTMNLECWWCCKGAVPALGCIISGLFIMWEGK